MSGFITFLKAWGIGITISAPLGPVGVLCIRNTLERGLKGALSVGSGAALADTAYSLVAAFGLTGVSFVWQKHCRLIQFVAGILLIMIGLYELRTSAPSIAEGPKSEKSLLRLSQKGLFLTLLNPMTFFGLTGLFSSMGLIYGREAYTLVIPAGVFIGCMTWWAFLGILLQRAKKHIPEKAVTAWMKYTSAALLFACALFSLFGGVCKS